MECVSKISAFYLCWLFHVDYRLSMLSITRRTCFLKRFIRSQYPSVHVPYEHWGLVISFCFCCLHQKYSCLCILSNAAIYKYFKQIKQKKKRQNHNNKRKGEEVESTFYQVNKRSISIRNELTMYSSPIPGHTSPFNSRPAV